MTIIRASLRRVWEQIVDCTSFCHRLALGRREGRHEIIISLGKRLALSRLSVTYSIMHRSVIVIVQLHAAVVKRIIINNGLCGGHRKAHFPLTTLQHIRSYVHKVQYSTGTTRSLPKNICTPHHLLVFWHARYFLTSSVHIFKNPTNITGLL